MQFKQSLRRRIIYSFVLFGAVVSLVIVTGVHFALEDIEETLVEDALQAELSYILQQQLPPLGTKKHINTTMTFYHVNGQGHDLLPAPMRALPTGSHEFRLDGDTYYLFSAATDEGRAYLVENATEFERREDALHFALTSAVAVAIVVALWLSIWLSGKVISPLSMLASQVSRLKPGAIRRTPIADQYAHDEVGQLATTFDTYLEQMEQFIRREQEFTADASHELRTPLAVINGACELLRENPDIPERAQRQLERIDRAGERMSQMLESLLLLARETPSDQSADTADYRVEEVVAEVIDQNRFLTRDKPIELHTDIVSGFSLNSSRTALSIVLSNLLRNAINYTDEGSVVVRINDRRIEIVDSGVGIDRDDLDSIFERHYRGRNVRQDGSGIGLSIVKRLCDRQHWLIAVDSEPGQGTTVTLDFPEK